jgi:hypothetical protein
MTASVVLLTLHLLGVAVMVGVVFVSLYYVTKLHSLEQLKDFINLRRIGSVGAGIAIVSGIAMAWRWAEHLRNDPVFMTKIGLVLADGIIAEFGFIKVLTKALSKNDITGVKNRLFYWAILSVLIVAAIIAISVYRSKLHG